MTIIRLQNCQTCKSSVAVPGQQELECRRFPPTATALLVPAGQGKVMVNTHSSFPRVPPDIKCDEWKPQLIVATPADVTRADFPAHSPIII